MDIPTTFAISKTTRDGRQLVAFSFRSGRLICPLARECSLLGRHVQIMKDLITSLFLGFVEEGAAPKGSFERSIEKLLKAKS